MVFSSISLLMSSLALFSGTTQVNNTYSFTKSNVDDIYIRCRFSFDSTDIGSGSYLSIGYLGAENYQVFKIAQFGYSEYGNHQFEFDYGYNSGESNLSWYFQVECEGLNTGDSSIYTSPMIYMYRYDRQFDGYEINDVSDIGYTFYVDCYIYWLDPVYYGYFEEGESISESVYNQGYADGRKDGEEIGYNLANDEWISKSAELERIARQEGYDYGVQIGRQQVQNDFGFTNLFLSIADTPVMMFRRLFDFSLFGTSMLAVIMSLFTCLLLIHVVKKIVR